MVDLGTDLLRTFVAVAETLNFTKASHLVHRTQSAVSQQIKRLESDLGKRLFAREGKGVSLSAEGEAFLPHARRILKVHDEALSQLNQPEMAGVIRVGVSDELATCFFPEILVRFAGWHPCLRVEVHCEFRDALTAKLARGELDLHLNTSLSHLPGARVLARTPLLWASAQGHLIHLEDTLPLAVFRQGCSYRRQALQALDLAGRPYWVAYSSPSLAGIQAAILSGLAVAPLIRPSLPAGAQVLGPEEKLPLLPMVNLYLARGRGGGPGVDRFCQLVEEVLRQENGLEPAGLAA